METRQLHYWVAIAEELSFTRAARRLHVSQPTLSVQVQSLEKELGIALLDRSRRQIALTAAGEVLLTEARTTLRRLEQSVATVRRAGSGTVGSLAVGFVPSASNVVLPPILRRFAATHPDVALLLREMAPDDLVRGLREQRLDISFLYLPFDDPAVASQTVSREDFICALPADHVLAKRRRIDVRTLGDQPFVLPARHSMPGLHAQVLEICRHAGFAPRAVQEDVWLVQTIVGLVAAGAGVALVPQSTEALGRSGVVYRPLRTSLTRQVELAAFWRVDHRSVVLSAFIDELPTAE